jgi:hypothetical protein
MDRRSTNVKGFVHFGGDVTSGVNDGIGVRLGSGSTGSTAFIESVSDDTNANLHIRAQGAGNLILGTSSNATFLLGSVYNLSGGIQFPLGGTIKGAFSTTFAWSLASLTSGAQGEITLTTAVGDIMPGDLIGQIELGVATAGQDDATVQGYRTSTAVTSRVTVIVGNIGSTATSTLSGTGRITWIDLT